MKYHYKMKPSFLVLFIAVPCILCTSYYAYEVSEISTKTYYVSREGNDNNDGTSVNSPWKSLKKLNEINFQPGDSVLFASNSEFRGGIVFKASGEPGKPIVLSCFEMHQNWCMSFICTRMYLHCLQRQ